jgi:hypothetical protein
MLGERQQALLPGGGVSKPVATAAALNLMIAVVEAAAGVRSGSVSLLVDSVHHLSDEMALILLFLAFIPPAGLSRNLRICEGRQEVHVNTTRIMAVAALIVASALVPHVARAQAPAPGITRTDRRLNHFKAVVTSQGDCHESRESRGGPTESRPV